MAEDEDPVVPRLPGEDAITYVRRVCVARGLLSPSSPLLTDTVTPRARREKPFLQALDEIWTPREPGDDTLWTPPYEPERLTAHDVVTIELPPDALATVVKHAKAAMVGGVSRVHGDADTRAAKLYEDQFVGQATTCAGHLFLLGHWREYDRERTEQNRTPTKGDGGSDYQGLPVDFKGSKMRGSLDPLDYRLPVRPHERHRGAIYVLALMPKGTTVYLVGWARESELPADPDAEGPFQGSFTIPAHHLNNMLQLPGVVAALMEPPLPPRRLVEKPLEPMPTDQWKPYKDDDDEFI